MNQVIQALFDSGWITSTFAAIALGSTLVIIAVILSENRNPVKSLSWVTVLLLLPVVGIILYIFFGRSIKNKRMISRRNRRRLRRAEKRTHINPNDLSLPPTAAAQANLLRNLAGAQLYDGNSIHIYTNGHDKFESLLHDIKHARHSINLEYYIFSNDKIGTLISDALIERAKNGVKVRLIYDHVGSFSVKSKFYKYLRENGVEAYPFFKVSFPRLGTRVNWRNHRKICIIDGAVAYIGGMNVADRYITGGKFDSWRDTHLRLTGPIVKALQYSFAVDWNFMGYDLIDIDETHTPPKGITAAHHTDVPMQLLTSGPIAQWSNIAFAFHKAIANAQKKIYIHTPYFLPNEALLSALQTAALAHIDVRIIIPHHGDSAMLNHATASYIQQCLKAGIKIYQYKAGMMHSKMIIIDDHIATIGSTNFDFRSFDYNFEANIFIYHKPTIQTLTEHFKADLAKSNRIQPAQWRHRPLHKKVAESVIRLISPVL